MMKAERANQCSTNPQENQAMAQHPQQQFGDLHPSARYPGPSVGQMAYQKMMDASQVCQQQVKPINPVGSSPQAVPQFDPVHRPAHYARYKIEPITFILANDLPYAVGNVIKYVMRYDAKDGRQDLEKAKRYIEMILEDLDRKASGTHTDVVGKPL